MLVILMKNLKIPIILILFLIIITFSGCVEEKSEKKINEKDEIISSISYLINHSEEYINKTITIEGTVTMGPTTCTMMMCPPENPCCNSCGAQLVLYDNTSMIDTSGSCGGTECNMTCSPLELHKTYKVTGIWKNNILEIISYELINS